MKDQKKLSRDEMKNVLGGLLHQPVTIVCQDGTRYLAPECITNYQPCMVHGGYFGCEDGNNP